MSRSLLALLVFAGAAHAETPLLRQKPAVSATQVAFCYAGDLWVVGRDGGDARRLTAGVGLESYPVFSPDGAQIAFAGEYEGNLDVYVVPAAGGVRVSGRWPFISGIHNAEWVMLGCLILVGHRRWAAAGVRYRRSYPGCSGCAQVHRGIWFG